MKITGYHKTKQKALKILSKNKYLPGELNIRNSSIGTYTLTSTSITIYPKAPKYDKGYVIRKRGDKGQADIYVDDLEQTYQRIKELCQT